MRLIRRSTQFKKDVKRLLKTGKDFEKLLILITYEITINKTIMRWKINSKYVIIPSEILLASKQNFVSRSAIWETICTPRYYFSP